MEFSAWTIGKKIASGYAVALLFLVLIGIVTYKNTLGLLDTGNRVTHTYQVLGAIAAIQTDLKDSEAAIRGFVISGDDSFLAPYREASSRIDRDRQELAALIVDNGRQVQRVERLTVPIDDKLTHLAQAVTLRRSGGFTAAQALVKTKFGLQSMAEVRRILEEIRAEELSLLKERAAAAEAAGGQTRQTLIVGTLAAFGTLLVIGVLVTRSLAGQIGTGVETLRRSSFELQAVANQQATGAGQQATSMNEIAATMRELIETSGQIAEGAQQVARIADDTAVAARSGGRAVEQAQQALHIIRGQVDRIVGHMEGLRDRSKEMGGILDITKELSEQTNILAINATIEAAGAGAQGARFAAVAEEIRKLAERVHGSTKDIRVLIDDIRTVATTIEGATDGGVQAVEAGDSQFRELAVAFHQIDAQVVTTVQAVREIELGTKQQASAVAQVNVAISDAARASRETEASSRQTLQTATHLSELSRELSHIVRARSAQEA